VLLSLTVLKNRGEERKQIEGGVEEEGGRAISFHLSFDLLPSRLPVLLSFEYHKPSSLLL